MQKVRIKMLKSLAHKMICRLVIITAIARNAKIPNFIISSMFM